MRALAPATFPVGPEVASGDTLLPMPTALVTGATNAGFSTAAQRFDRIDRAGLPTQGVPAARALARRDALAGRPA